MLRDPYGDHEAAVWDADEPFFFVDRREDDADIIDTCGVIVGEERLKSERDGDRLNIVSGGRRIPVPLTDSPDDPHITLLAINRALAPDYEVRYVWASHGSDTAGLLVLASAEWQALEAEFGAAGVDKVFLRLGERPNIFTGSLDPPKKRWWQFWK
jgi:hypothetical protein